MRYLYATLFFLVTINVSAQTTDWVKSFGGDLADKGISIGTDSLGYIYISGYFNTAADEPARPALGVRVGGRH